LLIDVTGHGPAAAQTVELLERHLLPDPCCSDLAPADLLRVLHGMLQSEWVATGRFVTALALLIGAQRTVKGGNAGQPEPLAGRPGGSWQPWSVPGGPPLGLPIPDAAYADAERNLGLGECLLAFTDGVSEAGARQGQQFQHGPLQTFLAGLPAGLGIDEVVARLWQALQTHVGPRWPEDDMTVLGIEGI
jgi:phosphoserine phosphatase RsbU/P